MALRVFRNSFIAFIFAAAALAPYATFAFPFGGPITQ
ncbi:MAG: hypothetical protein RIQ56_565, partial [Candidatus Parcubacteria bacterium]